jgi:hypothetical protein
MQMRHSIVDSTNLEEQRSKPNLVKFERWMQRAFNVASNSQVSHAHRTLQESGGHISCGVNLYGVCTNVMFKFVFHFQFLVLIHVQQFFVFCISNIWAPKD